MKTSRRLFMQKSCRILCTGGKVFLIEAFPINGGSNRYEMLNSYAVVIFRQELRLGTAVLRESPFFGLRLVPFVPASRAVTCSVLKHRRLRSCPKMEQRRHGGGAPPPAFTGGANPFGRESETSAAWPVGGRAMLSPYGAVGFAESRGPASFRLGSVLRHGTQGRRGNAANFSTFVLWNGSCFVCYE